MTYDKKAMKNAIKNYLKIFCYPTELIVKLDSTDFCWSTYEEIYNILRKYTLSDVEIEYLLGGQKNVNEAGARLLQGKSIDDLVYPEYFRRINQF